MGIRIVDTAEEAVITGVAVAELFACVVAQATNSKETVNINKKDLRINAFINGPGHNKHRRLDQYTLISKN